ncbi:heat shock protein DnaJ, partial [Tothia fuscella]
HYAVLGLTPNATKEEIRKAHRRLVAIHHPDKNHGKSPRTLQSNTDKFRNVQEAYEVLSDADRKATFD